MTAPPITTVTPTPASPGLGRRIASRLYPRRRVQLGLLLSGPLGWLTIAYLGALVILLLNAFWEKDAFTGRVEPFAWTLDAFEDLATIEVYRTVALRTLGMAVLVTLTDAILAFPIAYYMARVASPRVRNVMIVLVLVPLWANYLVKAYAWRTILSDGGVINWALGPLGIQFDGLSFVGLWIVFTYLWLPYMIIPVYAGLERIPAALLEASSDLGGRSLTTFGRVILPLAFPAVVAGSIFTFSLTLGDYIAPGLITSDQFIGTVIYSIRGEALPTAAAFSLVPIVVIVGYLLVARRLRAFDSL